MRKVLGAIVEANNKFNLIEANDKVAVGVSGGKDSMLLLYALHIYQKFAPFKFDLVGITLKLGFPNMDFNPVIEFCEKHGIEYHLVPTQVYEILQKNAENDKIQCSLCSKFKKALLIDKAKELGCNKVSMAHHMDDGIETLMMNAIYNGFLASFKPKMYLDRTDITFIRPFILTKEKEIIRAVKRAEIPVVPSTCPNDKHTSREDIKQWLHTDVYKRFPTAERNFKNMMLNPDKVVLWDEDLKE